MDVGSAILTPARALFGAALLCLLACAVAVTARLEQPELGLALEADPAAGVVRVAASRGLARQLPTPSVLVSVEAGGRTVAIEARDVIEEPDFFDTYAEMAAFFARQRELAAVLRSDEVTVTVQPEGEPSRTVRLRLGPPSLVGLPAVFWFQVAAAALAFLVSVWALVLRPRDLAVRLFAFVGATIPVFILPAAVYGTRELAVDGGVFRVLSSVNHTGANLFGCGLVAFFLSYPRKLVRTRTLGVVPAVVLAWLVLDIARLAPDQNWGSRAPILLEMLAAIVLGVVQWRATRGDPRGRAGLRWIGVSVLVGSGLFVFSMVGSSVLGWFPPLSQGYAFGFFLLMHVSFAFGLGRHRLFELDEWAYAILFWLLAAVAVIAADVLLVTVLHANDALSTGAVLFAAAFLYLPVRSLLWSRIASRRTAPQHEIFDAVLEVTFARDAEARAARWRKLLVKLFDPVEVVTTAHAGVRATIEEEGLRLLVPAAGALPAQRLGYPWQGRGLFGPRHARLADNLVELVRHAEGQREAFERGVRDERSRIARDMHDDVGAGLLSSLHRDDLASTREAIRRALDDVRAIVHELSGNEVELRALAADVRQETVQRLEAAGIEVDWPVVSLDDGAVLVAAGVHRHVTSMIRELASNVIKHSGARRVEVRIAARSGEAGIMVTFADDGAGFDPAKVRRSGLENLERRAAALGGAIAFTRSEDGWTIARFEVSLAPGTAGGALTSRGHAETPPP